MSKAPCDRREKSIARATSWKNSSLMRTGCVAAASLTMASSESGRCGL
jgi:hypothetical protein